MNQATTVPMFVSPSMSAALEQLDILLSDYHYSPRGRAEVLEYVAREGTTAGCPSLDPEDHHDAEMVLEESFAEVPFDSPAWDRHQDVLFDAEMLADGNHPWPIPVVSDDDDRTDPEDEIFGTPPIPADLCDRFRDPHDWPDTDEWPAVPPICGGAPEPEPEPFTPSDEDWEDYRRWAEEYERRAALARIDDARFPLWGYE